VRGVLAFGFALILLAGISARAVTEPKTIATVGALAPDFTLEQFQGPQVTLSALRGRPVILTLYVTWASKEQLTAAEALAAETGIPVYGVGLMEATTDVAKFWYETGIRVPLLMDPADEVQNDYRVLTAGPTFLVDASGILRARWESVPTAASVRGMFQ
jgi:peroxiredoxin